MYLYFLDRNAAPMAGPVEDILALSYTDSYHETGEFSVTLPSACAKEIEGAAYVLVLGEDAPSPFTDGKRTVGRIEKTVCESAACTVTLSGRLAESLLSERYITRSTHADGPVKRVIETVLSQNGISFLSGERAIAGLTFGEIPDFFDENGYIQAEQYLGGEVLEDWLRGFLAAYGASYRITYDEHAYGGPLVFSVYFPKDRTTAQKENAAAVFSASLATLGNATLTHDTRRTRNFALIAGEGEGADRVTETVDLRKSPDEPRRELYIDARDMRSNDGGIYLSNASYRAKLRARATQLLLACRETTRIEGSSTPTVALTAPLYPHNAQATLTSGKDFSLGDLCDVALDSPGIAVSATVTHITAKLENGTAVTYASFSCDM